MRAGEVAEQRRQVVRDHVERRDHPVGRARRHDPGLVGPLPGTSSARASSPSSSAGRRHGARRHRRASGRGPWTKRRRETPLTLGSPLDAERPLHAGERLGERLHALLHRALLGVRQLVVGRRSRFPRAGFPTSVEGVLERVVDLVRQRGVLGLHERGERVIELARALEVGDEGRQVELRVALLLARDLRLLDLVHQLGRARGSPPRG